MADHQVEVVERERRVVPLMATSCNVTGVGQTLGRFGELRIDLARLGRIFGSIGFFCFFAGAISGILTLQMKLFRGVDMTGNPLLYLTILLMIVSAQFITMGLLGEINIRTYHAAERRPIYIIKEIIE